MATGADGTVTQQFSMYPVSPLCLLPRCPLPPFFNEAGRVAASAPAVGGHRVNPARLLPLTPSSASASGLLTAAGLVQEGDEEGGEVTGGADTPGFHPPAQQNELYHTPLDT